jgi:hypothetical protein
VHRLKATTKKIGDQREHRSLQTAENPTIESSQKDLSENWRQQKQWPAIRGAF